MSSREGAERRGSAGAATALLAALVSGSCASAHNYLDQSGPSYVGNHASAVPVALEDRPLRVVTFNIEYGRRVDEAIVALRVYAPLRSPDVLCLQEMDAPGVSRIAVALGMNYVYYPASRDGKTGRDFGNAVLSPWPIETSWKTLLPHTSRLIHRGRAAVVARVLVGETPLLVYSIHLGSPIGISGGQRRRQAEAVLADLRARPEGAIVAGDVNSHSVGEVFEAAGLAWPTRDIGGTRGGHSFDHVFARGLAIALPPFAGVVREAKEASDHRPVWALLTLAPRQTCLPNAKRTPSAGSTTSSHCPS